MDFKKLSLEDKGIQKNFTVKTLPAIPAMKLLGSIALLLSDTALIKSVVLQQFIISAMQTGGTTEDNAELNAMLQMDTPTIIANLIQSVIRGLNADDNAIEALAYKALSSVTYHNGSLDTSADDALRDGQIKDFVVVLSLVYEVFVLNFSGAIDRLKKHLAPKEERIII